MSQHKSEPLFSQEDRKINGLSNKNIKKDFAKDLGIIFKNTNVIGTLVTNEINYSTPMNNVFNQINEVEKDRYGVQNSATGQSPKH